MLVPQVETLFQYPVCMQAAFLDLKLAGVLGELLGRLVPVLGQGADAGSLCTMVLEAILTLQDPETCLNPMAPALQRVPDETPAPTEVPLPAFIHAAIDLCMPHCMTSNLCTLCGAVEFVMAT